MVATSGDVLLQVSDPPPIIAIKAIIQASDHWLLHFLPCLPTARGVKSNCKSREQNNAFRESNRSMVKLHKQSCLDVSVETSHSQVHSAVLNIIKLHSPAFTETLSMCTMWEGKRTGSTGTERRSGFSGLLHIIVCTWIEVLPEWWCGQWQVMCTWVLRHNTCEHEQGWVSECMSHTECVRVGNSARGWCTNKITPIHMASWITSSTEKDWVTSVTCCYHQRLRMVAGSDDHCAQSVTCSCDLWFVIIVYELWL